jgi:hypothetical protein
MQRRKLIVYLTLAIVGLLGAREASAGVSCSLRSRCWPWAKKYVAQAHTACLTASSPGLLIPLCFDRQTHCSNSVVADCSWQECAVGGARARATSGPGGCLTWILQTGLGRAGDGSFDPADDPTFRMGEDKSGESKTLSNALFDEAARTVEIRLESGRLAATPGGLGQRLRIWIFRDESKGEGDGDPVPTDDTTLWTGNVALADGELAVTGFDPAVFTLSTDDLGRAVVTFADVATVVPLPDLSAEDFANLVVHVVNDEFAP